MKTNSVFISAICYILRIILICKHQYVGVDTGSTNAVRMIII